MDVAVVALSVAAGASARHIASEARSGARSAWRRLTGERYSAAQERRYGCFRERFPELPPLVDGCPQSQPRADGERVDWGCNDSELTLTRERRALGHTAEQALGDQLDDEGDAPPASPEAHLLAALVRWCAAIDRAQPADDLTTRLAQMQGWLSFVLRTLQRELDRSLVPSARLARAAARVAAVRAALASFDARVDAKLPRMRISQHRERLSGELDQALAAAGAAIFRLAAGGCERAPERRSREQLVALLALVRDHVGGGEREAARSEEEEDEEGEEVAEWERSGGTSAHSLLPRVAPLLRLLLFACRTNDDCARARGAARALGGRGGRGSVVEPASDGAVDEASPTDQRAPTPAGPAHAHMRCLGLEPRVAERAARALGEAAVGLCGLAESALEFERVCAGAYRHSRAAGCLAPPVGAELHVPRAAGCEARGTRMDRSPPDLEGSTGQPSLERTRAACAELRAAHSAACTARRSLVELLLALDDGGAPSSAVPPAASSRRGWGTGAGAGAGGGASSGAAVRLLGWLGAVLPRLPGGAAVGVGTRCASAWHASWPLAREELVTAVSRLDALRAQTERALHALAVTLVSEPHDTAEARGARGHSARRSTARVSLARGWGEQAGERKRALSPELVDDNLGEHADEHCVHSANTETKRARRV